MKNLLLALLLTLSFVGCSDEVTAPVELKSKVGQSVSGLTLNDQFEKSHTIGQETQKLIFAFSKDMAHLSNDFFEKQTPAYLAEHHAIFIADVSAAPSLIRSMFIMPGLKDFKHTVLIFEDKQNAAAYRHDDHKEEVMILYLNDGKIEKIDYVTTEDALAKAL